MELLLRHLRERKKCATTSAIAFTLLSIFLCCDVDGYNMPGMGLHSFKGGEIVKLKVNSLTSMKTLLPVGYYRLPFCLPADGKVRMDHENLGEFFIRRSYCHLAIRFKNERKRILREALLSQFWQSNGIW